MFLVDLVHCHTGPAPLSRALLALPLNSLPLRLPLLYPHWAWAEDKNLATSQAGLTVGQKCLCTKSREEEQTHSLCPQEAVKRSCPHRDPQPKSQFVLPQQPVALSSDKTQKDAWQLWVRVDGSLEPCGLWGLTEEWDISRAQGWLWVRGKTFYCIGVTGPLRKSFKL